MSHRYCGRDFHTDEIAQIRRLIAEAPERTRAELSRLTCRALAWYKTDGGLKDMSTRVAACCACRPMGSLLYHHRDASPPMPRSPSPRKPIPVSRSASQPTR